MKTGNRSFARLFSPLLLAAATLGCGVEPLVERPHERASPWDAPVIGVRSGWLQGQVGPAQVDAAAAPLAAYTAMSALRVVGVARDEERAVMLQVTLRTDDVELVPGVHEQFTPDDAGRLVLLGCVGQAIDVYDEFDSPADEVELDVAPAHGGGPGDVQVQLTGRWSHGAQEEPEPSRSASLTFVLVR